MGVSRLDKIVANAVRGVARRTTNFYANWTDARVRVAFVDWYGDNRRVEKEETLNLESSDITNIITPDFPKTIRNKGCYWISNNIPWYAKNRNKIAFRAELRKGQGKAEGNYLAMLWESTGDPNKCKVYYKTNYEEFSLDSRTANKHR